MITITTLQPYRYSGALDQSELAGGLGLGMTTSVLSLGKGKAGKAGLNGVGRSLKRQDSSSALGGLGAGSMEMVGLNMAGRSRSFGGMAKRQKSVTRYVSLSKGLWLYISILLVSCFMWSAALETSDLLVPNSITSIS